MKKTFVLLLALCMAAVLFAVPAFAEGEESTQPAEAGITDDSGLRGTEQRTARRHSDAGR